MNHLKRLSTAAIAKAVAVAFVLAILIGATVGFVGFGLALAGVLTDEALEHPLLIGFIFCLGLLPNIVGGYLAATFAGRDRILHGIVTGAALMGISGLFYLFSEDPFTLTDGVATAMLVPLAAVGAAIAKYTQ